MARKSRKTFKRSGTDVATVKDMGVTAIPLVPTAAYGRLSNENSGHENSETLKTQMDLLYSFIDEQPDLKLAESYMDNGYTGTNFDRPEFQRLMEDIRIGKIGCIVVKDLSRFGRDYLETGYYLETVLPHLNVRLIAINDNYDSSRADDRESLAVPIKNIVNAMYAKDMSKKICTAAAIRRQRTDVVPNGNAPFGYEVNDERTRYVADEEASVYIRTVFQWRRMGLTVDEIAKRMNIMLVPVASDYRSVKNGGESNNRKWSYSTVKMILNNQAYAGDTIMGKIRQSLYKSEECRRVPKDEWTIVPDTHEPLVSRHDLFEIENAAAGENYYTFRSKPYNVKAREAMNDQLTGLVYCKECGCRMNYIRLRNDYSVATPEELEKEIRGRKNGNGRTDYYICPPLNGKAKCGGHRISADLLKIVIMDQLDHQIRSMADMNKVLEKGKEQHGGKSPLISNSRKLIAVKAQLKDADNSIISLYEDFAGGLLDTDDYQSLKESRIEKKNQLLQQRDDLERTINRQQKMIDSLGKTVRELSGEDTGGGFDEKLVRNTVEKIQITKEGDIEIRFVFTDTVDEITKMMEEDES